MKINRLKTSAYLGALSLVFALALGSCSKEPLLPSEQPNKEYMDFSLELTPPGAFSSVESRALTEDNQNAITRADILVFKDNKMLYHKTGTVTNTIGVTKSVTVTLKTSQSENELFDIMVIANAPISFKFAEYKDQTKEALQKAFNVPLASKWSGMEFIMYGEVLQRLIKPTINNFQIQMLRSLARVDIGVGEYNKTDGIWTGLAGLFSLTEVRVYNTRNTFAVIPKATTLNASGNVKVDTPTIPTGTAHNTDPWIYPSSEITAGKSIQSTIFLAEAPNLTNRVTLLIGGSYKSGPTTYYHIDICIPKADRTGFDYLNILRNHLYRISITSVMAAGFTNSQDALASAPINITTTLTPIEEGGSGDIVFDDKNYLLTDVSNVIIYGVPDGVKSYNIASVKATFAAGASATISATKIPTTINLTSGVAKLISYAIPAKTTTGNITIQVGRLVKVIQFTVQPAVDAHFDVLPFANVASITVEEPLPWLTLSQNMKYIEREQQLSQIVGTSTGKAYLHFNENTATIGEPRTIRALVHRNNVSGTTGVVVEQLNLNGMVLGYFGGEKDNNGYKMKLAAESVEEFSERVYDDISIGTPTYGLSWGFYETVTNTTKKISGKESTITLAKLQNSNISGTYTIYNNYAARYCYDKNRGTGLNGEIEDKNVLWYLPAHNQLMGIWIANNGIVKPLTSSYWSATEYYRYSSWNIIIAFNGYAFNHTKEESLGVRCVRDI